MSSNSATNCSILAAAEKSPLQYALWMSSHALGQIRVIPDVCPRDPSRAASVARSPTPQRTSFAEAQIRHDERIIRRTSELQVSFDHLASLGGRCGLQTRQDNSILSCSLSRDPHDLHQRIPVDVMNQARPCNANDSTRPAVQEIPLDQKAQILLMRFLIHCASAERQWRNCDHGLQFVHGHPISRHQGFPYKVSVIQYP